MILYTGRQETATNLQFKPLSCVGPARSCRSRWPHRLVSGPQPFSARFETSLFFVRGLCAGSLRGKDRSRSAFGCSQARHACLGGGAPREARRPPWLQRQPAPRSQTASSGCWLLPPCLLAPASNTGRTSRLRKNGLREPMKLPPRGSPGPPSVPAAGRRLPATTARAAARRQIPPFRPPPWSAASSENCSTSKTASGRRSSGSLFARGTPSAGTWREPGLGWQARGATSWRR